MTAFTETQAKAILEHICGIAEYVYAHEGLYLALLTGNPAAKTEGEGLESLEPSLSPAYSRFHLTPSLLEVVKASPVEVLNNAAEELIASITSGSATITYWALCEKAKPSEKGKIVAYGTCTSTTISSTQVPVKIEAKKLKLTLI